MSLMCSPVAGQNRLARRVFGWSRGGSMMEATPGLPCLNLKSSENCHLVLHNLCLTVIRSIARSPCKTTRNSARRVAVGSTHMRFPISHENGEQGHALNYVCCGFPLATPPIKNHFDHDFMKSSPRQRRAPHPTALALNIFSIMRCLLPVIRIHKCIMSAQRASR
jgi:hypothetical protein